MGWEYMLATGEQIGISNAVGWMCLRCKVSCRRDNLIYKYYCPSCGDEWSKKTAHEIEGKTYAKIRPMNMHYVRAKDYDDLKLILKNRRVIYKDYKKMKVKKYLEFVKKHKLIEYIPNTEN